MKKYILLIAFVVLLTGCGNNEAKGPMFSSDEAVPFEIVKYEQKIAPVYGSLVPYITYAKTAAQVEELKSRFQVDDFEIDSENKIAVFIVTYSDSCGIAVDNVYDYKNYLAVQLLDAGGDNCEEEGVPHTFVLQVDKKDYEKVQLYNGNVIKSSADVE